MGSSSAQVFGSSEEKELNNVLQDAGNRLLNFNFSSHSISDLLLLLEKAENILEKVDQNPPTSTGESLLPIRKALITDKLLLHPNINIRIAVASCMNELTRITAPDFPYPDDKIKVVFQLFMVALKQFSSVSANVNPKSLKILETVAEMNTIVLVIGVASEMITDIFQLFLNSIRTDHHFSVFKHMELIMTTVIEECNEISSGHLEPLLASVRMDNRDISPVSWELGITVIENCATKLQPYLRKVVKSKNLDLSDYAEIISSLCEIAPNGRNMKPGSLIDYKEELINSRIQVWWSGQKMFYTGTITGFDPVKKRHKIIYDDGDEEILNLKTERWKLLSDKMPRTSLFDYKEEVVNSRVQVWWTGDKKFYTGTVASFDPVNKKHKIVYDDGDIEISNLRRLRWKLFSDKRIRFTRVPQKEEEAVRYDPSPPILKTSRYSLRTTSMMLKKPGKGRKPSSNTQLAIVPSKRESCGLLKSGENSAPVIVRGINHVKQETRETDVSFTTGLTSNAVADGHMQVPKRLKVESYDPVTLGRSSSTITNCLIMVDNEARPTLSISPNEKVDVNGYAVKASSAPILRAIFAKYGDIAAPSVFKSKPVIASLLEVICDIFQKLQNSFLDDILLNFQAIEYQLLDIEAARIEISWLHEHLAKFKEVSVSHNKKIWLKKSKVNVGLFIAASKEKLKQRRAELVRAEERVREAEKCVAAYNIVSRKIDADINNSENEENLWRRRLGGISESAESLKMLHYV